MLSFCTVQCYNSHVHRTIVLILTQGNRNVKYFTFYSKINARICHHEIDCRGAKNKKR